MAQFNVYEAKTKLSEMINRAMEGEEIIIARAGRPVAKLVGIKKPSRIPYGALRGKISMSDDFDAPLTEEELALFEGGKNE